MATPNSKNGEFTSNELKVIQAFIKKKYPNGVRSIGAVVKETQLDIEVVEDIFDRYDRRWFVHVGDGYFSFNLLKFTARFGRKFLSLYRDYEPAVVLAYIKRCEEELNAPQLAIVTLPCVDEDAEISAEELLATVDPAILANGLIKDMLKSTQNGQ
jgi:hypothetical protein